MATERQIAANRQNAALSSGPKTEAGKATSRANALKHGLCSESIDVEVTASPAFQERREDWAAEYRPEGKTQGWALDRAVAASFRIERCERAMDLVIEATTNRAELAWGEDREIEVGKLGSRLSKNPSQVARELEGTWHGVALMVGWWTRLGEPLKKGEDWSEAEANTALDLLGIPTHLRSGRTPIDNPEAGPSVAYRLTLVSDEIDRLKDLQQSALEPLDDMARRHATLGDLAMFSTPGKLVARYEREAWARYEKAVKILNDPAPDITPEVKRSPVVAPSPVPKPVPPPQPGPEVVEEPVQSREELLELARVSIAASMKELGIEGFPPGFDYFLAMQQVDGTNPIFGLDEPLPAGLGER